MSACVASMWTWAQVHSVHVYSQTLQVMPEISAISGEAHRQMDPKSSLASLHSLTAAFRLVRGPVLQEGTEAGSHWSPTLASRERHRCPHSHAWTTHTYRYIKGRKGKCFNQYANKCQQDGLASKNKHHIKARVQSGDPQNEGGSNYIKISSDSHPCHGMLVPHIHADTHAQNKLKF